MRRDSIDTYSGSTDSQRAVVDDDKSQLVHKGGFIVGLVSSASNDRLDVLRCWGSIL